MCAAGLLYVKKTKIVTDLDLTNLSLKSIINNSVI